MAFPVQQVQLPQIDQVPPPLMMGDPSSFAYHTYSDRWPSVVERIVKENSFDGPTVKRLRQLTQDLFNGTLRSLQDRHAPDWEGWEQDLSPYLGQPWVEVPWLFAEFYFYRRILEAVAYFSGDTPPDPFASQKQAALQAAGAAVRPAGSISESLYGALWGNRADLSLKPAQTWQENSSEGARTDRVLVDQTAAIARYLQQAIPTKNGASGATGLTVDLVADNAGAELISDLALAASLLDAYPKTRVRLHLKAYPTFVSDATIADVDQTLGAIAGSPLGLALQPHLDAGALQLQDNPLWNRPLAFWQLREELSAIFEDSQLVILKGDANYRRLLGDCSWPPTAHFSAVSAYFPCPVAALRTLKSELVIGLTSEQITYLNDTHSGWMTAGEWGVIQSRLD